MSGMSSSYFHILNGGSTAETFRRTGIPGEHFVWREILSEGPTPCASGEPDSHHLFDEHVLKLRAYYLKRSSGVPPAHYLKEMRDQEEILGASLRSQELVLWFEADFFCQMNLIGLLRWLASQEHLPSAMRLIYAETFPGKPDFRGLGELNETQLKSLYSTRVPVEENLLRQAERFWSAYCSPDPSNLLKLKSDLTPAWMRRTLELHLRRFPSFETGLNAVEEQTLRLLLDGPLKIADLFQRIGNCQATRAYGMGDLQYWGYLATMKRLERPLISIDGPPSLPGYDETVTRSVLDRWTAEIADFGREVLSGASDSVHENGIDAWLGGLHLSGKHSIWRWRETDQTLLKK